MSMDIIRDVMDEFEKRSFTEIECELNGVKIRLSKNVGIQNGGVNVMPMAVSSNITVEESSKQVEENYKVITSPMVGTFYSCPKPNSKSYVEKGDIVKKGDIVCIIEAMKLMNEIESEIDGEIVEVLVKDGEMIEFGQELFKVK